MEIVCQLYHLYVRAMFVSNIQSILEMYNYIYFDYNHHLIHLYGDNKETNLMNKLYSGHLTLIPNNTIDYYTCEWKDHCIV